MRKLLIALLAVIVVFAVADIAYAQGKGHGGGGKGGGARPGGNPGGGDPGAGPKQDPKGDPPKGDPAGGKHQGEGKPDIEPEVVGVVRALRKLMWALKQMEKEGADSAKMERVEEQIRKLISWLDEHDVKWRKMNKHEKCCLDPEVAKLIRAMEWLRNELKGLDPEKDKKKIAKIMRKMHQIMKALSKKQIGDDEVPDDLKPPKGHKEAENGKCKGKCNHERKRDESCGDCPKGDGDGPKGDGDGPKGDGDCPKGDGDCPKGDGDCPKKT